MQERFVTIDGEDYRLSSEFMVVATQNPIEQQGTYPLPEAQLDRFLFKHIVDYPSRDDERDIVRAHGSRTTMTTPDAFGIEPVAGPADLAAMCSFVEGIRLGDDLVDYVVDLIRASREHPGLSFGASPRAANMLAVAARAYAALDGRDYVIPDDIKYLAPPTLRHRIVLSPGSEIEGLNPDQIVAEIIEQTPVPK